MPRGRARSRSRLVAPAAHDRAGLSHTSQTGPIADVSPLCGTGTLGPRRRHLPCGRSRRLRLIPSASKQTLYIFDELYMNKQGNYEAFQKLSQHMETHGMNIARDRITADSAEPKSRLDLTNESWYVFNDNYGTSEEKLFVKYFKTHIEPKLKEKNLEYYVVRLPALLEG